MASRAQSAPGATRKEASPLKKDKKDLPAWAQPPFHKQITRSQAITGKLLEDITLVRMMKGAESSIVAYDTKHDFQSHNLNNLGTVREFPNMVGRVELSKSGTRFSASGILPSHWHPLPPPNDSLVRPKTASSGPSFDHQITRQQDVNGKLLEDNAMCRFLFGQVEEVIRALVAWRL
jgi:hypothetical protein